MVIPATSTVYSTWVGIQIIAAGADLVATCGAGLAITGSLYYLKKWWKGKKCE